MEKSTIYLDTSVIAAYFDFRKPVRQLITQKWFSDKLLNFQPCISTLVLAEIGQNPDIDLKAKMVSLIKENDFSVLEMTKEIELLSEKYRTKILKNELNDSIHIAIASFYDLDAIVSWKFKHIVNLKTMNTIHKVNLDNNYGIIEILTIENLGGSDYGNL